MKNLRIKSPEKVLVNGKTRTFFVTPLQEFFEKHSVDSCFIRDNSHSLGINYGYKKLLHQNHDKLPSFIECNKLVLDNPYNVRARYEYALQLERRGYTFDAMKHFRLAKALEKYLKKPFHKRKREDNPLLYNYEISWKFEVVNCSQTNDYDSSTNSCYLYKLVFLFMFIKNIITDRINSPVSKGIAFASLSVSCIYTVNAQSDGIPDNEIYYPFKRPATHEHLGKHVNEYYASGDVNLDDSINLEDAELIRNGVKNDMADVARPYGVIDEADAQTIENYVNLGKKFIGKDYWSDDFSNEERADHIMDLYHNVYMKSFGVMANNYGDSILIRPEGWDCNNFTTQAEIDFKGMTDVQLFLDKFYTNNTESFKQENNGRFNIYAVNIHTFTQNDDAHNIVGFPIGKDLTKTENYLVLDGRTGYKTDYGGFFMTRRADFNWNGVRVSNHPARGPPLISFLGDTASISWLNPYFNTKPDSLPPKYTPSDNVVVSYNDFKLKGLEEIAKENNPKDVMDNVDVNPVINYTIDSNQTHDGTYSDFNFDAEIEFKASDFEGNDSISKYSIFIRDQQAPTFDVPADVNYNYSDNINIEPSETGEPTNIVDNTIVTSIDYNDESNQIMDRTINEVNYTISRTWNVTDITGNVGSGIQKINIADTQKPEIGVSDNYIKINSSENSVKAAKSLVNYTYDNSWITDTIVTNTSGNYYDVQGKDVAGNLSDTIEVEVDKSVGIVSPVGANKPCDLETIYPNPILNNVTILYTTTEPGEIRFIIINTSGQTVEFFKEYALYGENHFQYNFSNLPVGMYFIKVEGCEGKAEKIEIR